MLALLTIGVAGGLAVAVAGCNINGTTGAGPQTTEARSVGPFTMVDVNNGIRLTVHIGPAESVKVTAQQNIVPMIATQVEGETLRISSTGSFMSLEPVAVTVVTPSLDGITVGGGSNATITDLAAAELTAKLTGGSVLTASGTAANLNLDLTGGSRAEVEGVEAGTVAVDLTGGSIAVVQASDEVSGRATGGSHLTVEGQGSVTVEATGGSEVTHE
jgi:hypothetical protein